MKTTTYYAQSSSEPDLTAVLYIGAPVLGQREPVLDVLTSLQSFKAAFRVDHALGTKHLETHYPLVEAISDPATFPVLARRLKEDLPNSGTCVFFLPELNARDTAPVLAALTDALHAIGFSNLEMVVPTSYPEKAHPIVEHADESGWGYDITVTDFAELPELHASIIAQDAIQIAVANVEKALSAAAVSYSRPAIAAKIALDWNDLSKSGIAATASGIPAIAKFLVKKFSLQTGLE